MTREQDEALHGLAAMHGSVRVLPLGDGRYVAQPLGQMPLLLAPWGVVRRATAREVLRGEESARLRAAA